MNIHEAITLYFTQLEANGRSFHTIKQYHRHLRLFSDWMREECLCGDLDKITHDTVARFFASPMAKIRATGGVKKSSSINALKSSIKCFFRYLHQAGYSSQDHSRLLKRSICGTPPPRSLSVSEKDRLIEVLKQGEGEAARRDSALIHLMLGTGIRLGSALALNVEDIDVDNMLIRLNNTKRNQPEQVYMGNSVQAHLVEFIGEMVSGPLFIARNGHRVSGRHIQRRFSLWLEKAEITRPASPHSLRHTFATALYQRTSDIFLVKEALRHRSINSTLVYAHADDDKIRQAISFQPTTTYV